MKLIFSHRDKTSSNYKRYLEFVDIFNEGIELYISGNWEQAKLKLTEA